MRVGAVVMVVAGLVVSSTSSAWAQTTTDEARVVGAIEGIGGWAGFADDALIHIR